MEISSETKISALIKVNPASIDAIASINKHFEKLRNPILRKILASRVTISDAARIGGCSIDDFFKKLEPLGFTVSIKNNKTTFMTGKQPKPQFLATLDSGNTITLDVRAELSSGKDPFQKIMKAITNLPKGNTLLIINTFEPTPLIGILKKKGYEHFTEQQNGAVYTYFNKTQSLKSNTSPDVTIQTDFDTLLTKYESNLKTIDVRELEMPLPMVTILEELSGLPSENALYVHHKKIPQFLLPELKERGFQWSIKEIAEGDVKLLIFKK